MPEYVVSFCVPVFNKSDVTFHLVTDLLQCNNPLFQIVISDNCSDDDTIDRLSDIADSRVKVVKTHERVRASLNWYNALVNGEGEYLYFVVGRDKIRADRIDELISLLIKAKEADLCCLFDEVNRDDVVEPLQEYLGKYEAYKNLVRRIHPTGTIFRRKEFQGLDRAEFYYSLDYTYPENFVRCELIASGKSGTLGCCKYIQTKTYISESVKSTYDGSIDIPFGAPMGHTRDVIKMYLAVAEDQTLSKLENRKLFFWYYQTTLRYGSLAWEQFLWNGNPHYGVEPRKVHLGEKLWNINQSMRYTVKQLHKEKKVQLLWTMEIMMYTLAYSLAVCFRIRGYYDPPGERPRSTWARINRYISK